MTIIEALKKDESLRITNGDKWLVFDQHNQEWVVCERKPRKRHSATVERTHSEERAINVLLKQ